LWLETHVQHTISLIENKVLDVLEGNAATLNQVDKTTWSGNEEIASTLDLAKLRSNIGTTVNNAWSDPRSVGELTGLFVNLRDQLTGWSKDKGCWVCLALASKAGTSASWRWGWTVDESLGQDWEQETSGLSGTSLGTSHQITSTHDNWDGVLLDWCWDLVMSKLNVANEMVVQWWVGELEDWLWDIVSGSLDWDIVVLLEVDTSLLLGWVIGNAKELTLNTWVCWSGDVLAIFILSITATASDGRASGGSSRVPVCVGIESSRGAGILPSATTTRWRSTTRSEGWSISPVSAWARSIGIEAVGSSGRRSSPGTGVQAGAGTDSRTWSIHRWWSCWWSAAHLAPHVRWDVGALLSEGESIHVELFSHVDEAEVAITWCLVSFACEAMGLIVQMMWIILSGSCTLSKIDI
jgi:hypothetical protein